MTRLLYVDAVAGVAGDMLLAALLDAGADQAAVRTALAGLGVPGLDLEVGTVTRHSIAARSVKVVSEEQHAHRTWVDVRELIAAAGGLPARARERAQGVFALLAEAEGRVHGIPPEQVHFHEVGAADAIGDVCGIAVALESLGIDEIVCSPLPLARGFTQTAHGTLPLPAPAVLELLRGAPLHGVELEVELVTPTGAAVVAALAREYGPVPAMRLSSLGYGAGARDLPELPNLVRVLVGEPVESHGRAHDVSLIETNLDDLSPEFVPDVAEACFAAGAVDVWITPTQMKKGRPGIVISALAKPAEDQAVAEAMLVESGTLGVRVSTVRRWELERHSRTVEVAGRQVRVKIGSLNGRALRVAPEHDDCAAVAKETGASATSVWSAALAAAQEELER
jgi:pyridinium-3,5-bisthiocarboxylic acid mononucleotide nickel chelatase